MNVQPISAAAVDLSPLATGQRGGIGHADGNKFRDALTEAMRKNNSDGASGAVESSRTEQTAAVGARNVATGEVRFDALRNIDTAVLRVAHSRAELANIVRESNGLSI